MLLLELAPTVLCVFDIRDYGAIANDDSLNAEQTNAAAFEKAILAANSTMDSDRIAYVPSNLTFHMMPVEVHNLFNMTITIDGTIMASKRQHKWPVGSNNKV